LHLPDYGLPDVTKIYSESGYDVANLCFDIRQCILKYEPRIKEVDVISLPQDRAQGLVILELRCVLHAGLTALYTTYFKSEGNAVIDRSPSYD
jgi:type VI secretion system protein